MDALRNYMIAVEQGQRIAAADVERAQALQSDATFWEPYEEPNKFKCLKLWHAICAFGGMNPAHRALSSPDYAARMERHTSGEVAARLKELLRLHTAALDGITMALLKAPVNETKGFETNMDSLIKWAVLVGEALPAQRTAPDTTSGQSTPDDQSSDEKMSKRGLINAHKHHWPTIEGDIDQAAKNGLNAAKVGARKWYEGVALNWARNNGKLVGSRSPTSNGWCPS